MCLHGGQEGHAGWHSVSSVLALPCCPPGGNVDWDGGGAEGAPAIASEEEAPPIASLAARGGGGGMRSMSATDLVAFGRGRCRTHGGDRRHG